MRLINADELIYITIDEADPPFSFVPAEFIDAAPAIDPVNHGRWIQHGVGHENVPWGFDCSECAEWFVIDHQYIARYRYCPNCGARNEVEE